MWNIKFHNVDFIPPHFSLWNTKLHNVEFIPQLCKFISTSPWIEGTCRKKKLFNWHNSWGSSLRNLRPCCFGKPHVVKDIQDGCLHPRWRCKVTWHTSRSFLCGILNSTMWISFLHIFYCGILNSTMWNLFHNCVNLSPHPHELRVRVEKKVENNWHSSCGDSLFVCWI